MKMYYYFRFYRSLQQPYPIWRAIKRAWEMSRA